MSVFTIGVGVLWAISALFDAERLTYIWQLKEYRIDRFRDFIETTQGKRYITGYQFFWHLVVLLVFLYLPINTTVSGLQVLFVLFLGDAAFVLLQLIRKQVRIPVHTKKALVISMLSIVLEASVYALTQSVAVLLLLVTARFLTHAGIVRVFAWPTTLYKRWYVSRATKKMAMYKDLLVIGVTGSYGKTSVKHYLHHILCGKFRVLKTPKNINTEIGVAQFILRTDLSNFDVFVVEMGAYREHDIEILCKMVQPRIGILTAIGEEHLSLFGNIKTTQKTKYELLRSLPKDGLAVVNSDNALCREFLSELDTTVETFGIDDVYEPTFEIDDIDEGKRGVRVKATMRDLELQYQAPLHGAHVPMNIAPCFLVATHLGMTVEQVQEKIQTLKTPERRMQMYELGEAIIIDDTYNSNPQGFKSALLTLSGIGKKKNKVVITRGMLELGTEAAEQHTCIGEEIAFTADDLVIIDKAFEPELRTAVTRQKYKTQVHTIIDPAQLTTYLKDVVKNPSVVLLENRLPDSVYDYIQTHRKPMRYDTLS